MRIDNMMVPAQQLLDGRMAIEKGNDLRSKGGTRIDDTLAAYAAAVTLLSPYCGSELSPIRDDLASAWTNRGIALMAGGVPSRLQDALGCFDMAIGLRATLIALGDPWHRYNLMGVWINRGDALASLGGSLRTEDAVRCYDEALVLATGLDAGLSSEFPRRIAVAHCNRGAALRQLTAPGHPDEACLSYDSAIAVLNLLGRPASLADTLMEATAWVGKAEALGASGAEAYARSCARRALELAAPMESDCRDAVVIGLKARLVICSGACRGMARTDSLAPEGGMTAEAIDMAEDGLRLAGRRAGDGELQMLVQELFRFGTQAYAARQPQFLVEFIREFLPMAQPSLVGPMRVISAQAVALAIGNVATRGILNIGRAGIDDTVSTFRDLRQAKERLEGAGLPA